MMVPVKCASCALQCASVRKASTAMPVPLANLISQSGADQHEPCSARNCNELGMLGDCHEGPTTRASHGEPRSPKHLQERAREEEEARADIEDHGGVLCF